MVAWLFLSLKSAKHLIFQQSINDKLEKKNNILDSISDAIISFDHNNKLVYVNSQGYNLFPILQLKSLCNSKIERIYELFNEKNIFNNIKEAIKSKTEFSYNQFFPKLNKHFSIKIKNHSDITTLYMNDISDIQENLQNSSTMLNKT